MIDYLQPRFDNDDVGIAFLYCDYNDQLIQTAEALIGSLAKQLVLRYPDVPDNLKVLYNNRSEGGQTPTLPTLSDCIKLLESQLDCYSTIYLVIDALDECKHEARTELCSQLQNLPKNVHLLIMSRPNPELESQINPSVQLEIRADGKDIEVYLEDRIEKTHRLKQHTKTDLELHLLIISTIRDAAKGMYVSLSRLNSISCSSRSYTVS